MKVKIQKFWYLKKHHTTKTSTLFTHKRQNEFHLLTFLCLPNTQHQANTSTGWKRERRQFHLLAKLSFLNPLAFCLLAVDSAETPAAESIMGIFKGPTHRIARPTCHTNSLARTPFPQPPFHCLQMHFQGERG